MRILLQPAAGKNPRKHFEDTISNGVLVNLFKGRVSEQDYKKLEDLNERYIEVWGMVPTLQRKTRKAWVDLESGDTVLFYANKSFGYRATAYFKIHNPSLAEELWGFDDKGRTWEYMYFIKDGTQIELPYEPSVIGYDQNHVVQGAILLDVIQTAKMSQYIEKSIGESMNEDKVEPTAKEEKDFTKTIRTKEIITPEEADAEIERLSEDFKDEPVKERIKKSKILARNPKFARLVKERASYICEICGQEPFIQKNSLPYAEAHHKYELAKNRVDNPKNMICVCPLCHKIIHYGNDESFFKRAKSINK